MTPHTDTTSQRPAPEAEAAEVAQIVGSVLAGFVSIHGADAVIAGLDQVIRERDDLARHLRRIDAPNAASRA